MLMALGLKRNPRGSVMSLHRVAVQAGGKRRGGQQADRHRHAGVTNGSVDIVSADAVFHC